MTRIYGNGIKNNVHHLLSRVNKTRNGLDEVSYKAEWQDDKKAEVCAVLKMDNSVSETRGETKWETWMNVAGLRK